MAGVRSLLNRVARLEQARKPRLSPFESAFNSLEAFEVEVQTEIDAGKLDRIDMPVVLACIRRWHKEGVWAAWQRDVVWEYGR